MGPTSRTSHPLSGELPLRPDAPVLFFDSGVGGLSVLAVLQAMQTRRGRKRSLIRPSSPATRAAISASLFAP